MQVPFDRGLDRYVGKYSVSFITITISEQKEGLYMSVPMYGEGILQQVNETLFKGENSGQAIKVEFELSGEGPAEKFILYQGSEKITFKRKG